MYIPEVLFNGIIALQSCPNYLSALTSTISNPLYSPFSTIWDNLLTIFISAVLSLFIYFYA